MRSKYAGPGKNVVKRVMRGTVAMGLILLSQVGPIHADTEAIAPFLDARIERSVLSRKDQESEMAWFAKAALPFDGMRIRVVSEDIATHRFEAEILAPAFSAITGIEVTHEFLPEDRLVETLQAQLRDGATTYDAYVNDSDLIGTHWRERRIRDLTTWMAGEGKSVTSPTLGLRDFIGLAFNTAPDGKLYQLPDQQFANLYWFRHDWFTDPVNMTDFEEIYGYPLGVPVTWAAYEDIAAFFTGRDLSHLGVEGPVYGHMDYGARDPSLSWRFTDGWMSLAGVGSIGEPNGRPVDDWGIRVNDLSQPVGACVERGGAANSPAAVYAVQTYLDWLDRYAPPGAIDMTFAEAAGVAAKGNIAQQVFWYTSQTATMIGPDAEALLAEDGTPRWRMAPSPHGAYWRPGMKVGYQDAGAWALPVSVPVERARAAWLYAQFVTSMTVDVEKSHAGLTFVRQSTVNHPSFDDRAAELGGLIEFYRSPARMRWSPTGTNVPDYPAMVPLWWQNIGDVTTGLKTPQQALDTMCAQEEGILSDLSDGDLPEGLRPVLDDPRDPQYWLDREGSPRGRLKNERGTPETIPYDEVQTLWR